MAQEPTDALPSGSQALPATGRHQIPPQTGNSQQPEPSTPHSSAEAATTKRDLTAIGTMVAAFAAAGGLIASAWTGYYQVQATKDQLTQSAEESEKDLQAQASLISAWSMEDKHGLATAYLANRSLDPISQVIVVLGTGRDKYVQEGKYSGPSAVLELSDVPPLLSYHHSACDCPRCSVSDE
ncbi:hypothetical protein ABZS88_41585 [Streptomyces sp. NPDC005480]|uniref:hypothetical protein n=1 Tax=Streptomyces sp. NPDC005480 TaxID=3154880 RepID=UPI0033B371B7